MSLGYWSGRSAGEAGRPAAIEPGLTAREALAEMREIMCLTAGDQAASRMSAVRYTRCRSVLIESDFRSSVPGFLVQCVSLSRFHDFISLLDPNPKIRIAFIDAAFAGCRDTLEAHKKPDVFGDRDF